jgi:hypothetical protein
MAFPFAPMPSLKEFIEAAVREGCREGISRSEIPGRNGPMRARYLVGRNGVPYILPDIDDHECLTPTVLASMRRALRVDAFRDQCAHLP